MYGRLLPFFLVLTLLPTGCEKAKLKEVVEEPVVEAPKKSYPFLRDLRDSQGREIKAEVLGRDESRVTFVRWSDKKRFTVPIANLSPADQSHLLGLPVGVPRAPDPERITSPQRESKREKKVETPLTGYAALLQGRIEETKAEIAKLSEELRSAGNGTIKNRTLNSKLKKLDEELAELTEKLDANR
ncbi:MAG: hypothetical protein P1U87_05540 [Verrucomicrobiales bacterium]|nr:hypothetical protein [Verrucomicrobiales bacterium]